VGEGEAMPVLHQNRDGSGYTVQDVDDDSAVVYDLRPEGAQILLNVYGIKVGGAVEAETLEKLVGLRLASPRPVEAPPAPPPPAEPVSAARKPLAPKPTPAAEPRPHPARHQRRTRGREVALQVLYQVEQNPGLAPLDVDRFLQRRLQDAKLCDFARSLVAGVKANQPAIDAMITEVAENWRLDRMAAIDRNILRLGAFEMLFDEGVPDKVAINEALELAKRYSTAQSSRFVNGILDRLLTLDASKKAAGTGDEPPTEAPAEG
jgi:transcription antitermination protein NusB